MPSCAIHVTARANSYHHVPSLAITCASPANAQVSDTQRQIVHAHVLAAAKAGAKCLVGGNLPPASEKGTFYPPTVISGQPAEIEPARQLESSQDGSWHPFSASAAVEPALYISWNGARLSEWQPLPRTPRVVSSRIADSHIAWDPGRRRPARLPNNRGGEPRTPP